jgi:hypothetical protein
MAYPFLDTDIIIPFLTGDDPQKQAAAVVQAYIARQKGV